MPVDNSPLGERNRLLFTKVEAATGTLETFTVAEGVFNVYEPKVTLNIPLIERPAIDGYERMTGVSGARFGAIEFGVDLVGLATGAGTPPWADAFLPACGFVKTSQTYALVSNPATLITNSFALNEAGRRRNLSGCQGSCKISLKNGEPGRVNFRFIGLLNADTDVAMLVPTFPTALPPRWANAAAFSYGSFTGKVSKAEVDFGRELVMRPDPTNASGYRSAYIADGNQKVTIDPEASLVAAQDWYGIQTASTEAAVSLVVGTVTNNVITIGAPKAQVAERPGGARDKIITEGDLVLNVNRNANTRDSGLTIVFA